jgi:integrase
VLILANTGMRHGTESYGLKWKQISFHIGRHGRRYLILNVDGKTGKRELAARSNVAVYLQRIQSRCDDIKDIPFEQLIEQGHNKFVFRLNDGTQTTSLGQTFEILLKDAGLLVDRRTDQNRTLYSLRHTYATLALLYARMEIHVLATQMGTSVGMIERHYSHLTPRLLAEQFAGPDWDELKKERKATTENRGV